MRRLAMMAAAAAFFGGGAVASAADLGSYKDSPSYAAAPVWTGLYVGGHLGGMWNGDRNNNAKEKHCDLEKKWWWWYWDCNSWNKTEDVKFDDEDDNSFIGGLHVGYNYQKDSTVIGIEADVSFADELDYLASLRARLGYARGNLLLYATAGVAFAGLDNSVSFKTEDGSYNFGDDQDRSLGFVAGAGVEYKLRPNLSIGVEGLYYRFGDDNNKYQFTEYYSWDHKHKFKVEDDKENDFWTVRARVSYHFGEDHDAAPLK